MNEAEMLEKQEQLSSDRIKLERDRLEFEQKKLQRLTISISAVAVIVSLLQVGVAFLQSRLATAQTVEKFIPHLQKQETRDAALLTMSAFTDQGFVTQLAAKLKATSVLETLQSKGSVEEKKQASAELSSLDKARDALIEQIFNADKQTRIQATTTLIRQWMNDSKVVPDVIEAANAHLDNQNGIINALVVLREAPPETLRANLTELSGLTEKVKSTGPQTAALVSQVLKRSTQGQ